MSQEVCPNCGADLPKNAPACPDCGADETTGWSDQAEVGALDLPEEKFDYSEFVEKEFGENKIIPHPLRWYWWLVALLLAGLLFYFWLGR